MVVLRAHQLSLASVFLEREESGSARKSFFVDKSKNSDIVHENCKSESHSDKRRAVFTEVCFVRSEYL